MCGGVLKLSVKFCYYKFIQLENTEFPFCCLTNYIFICKTTNWLNHPFSFPVFLGYSDSRPSRCLLLEQRFSSKQKLHPSVHSSFCSTGILLHKELKAISLFKLHIVFAKPKSTII